MFKKIIQSSVDILFKNPKIIRLSFLTLVFYSIVRIYYIIFYFNNILIYKYESGIQYSDALLYFIRTLTDHQALGRTIALIVLIIVGYLWLHPIGDAAIIFSLENPEKGIFRSFAKGMTRFFPMLEYGGLGLSFGVFTFCTVVIRLYLMDVFDNVFVKILVVLWGSIVLFAAVFRSYAKTIIALEGLPVFDAIKKSTRVAFANIGISIKLMFLELLLMVRFIVNAFIIVGIPLGLIYFAVWLDIIDNSIMEAVIWIIAGVLLILFAYINSIIEAFFLTYRYQAYKHLQEKEKIN